MLRAARVGGSQQLRGHSRLPVYLGLGRSSYDRRVLRYDQRGAPLESFATLRPVSKAGYISANLSSQVLLPLFKFEPETDEYWLISRRLVMERRWHCGHLQWRGSMYGGGPILLELQVQPAPYPDSRMIQTTHVSAASGFMTVCG